MPVVDAPDDGSCLAFDPEAVSQLGQPTEVHLSARRPVRERDLRDGFATAERIVHIGSNVRFVAQPPAHDVEHVRPRVEQDPLPSPAEAECETGRAGPTVLRAVIVAEESNGADRALAQ